MDPILALLISEINETVETGSNQFKFILELVNGTSRKCFGNWSKLKFGPDYEFYHFLPELTPIN